VMLVVADGEALDDALMAAEKHAASREAPGEEKSVGTLMMRIFCTIGGKSPPHASST